MPLRFLAFLMVVLLLPAQWAFADIPETEREALLSVYRATGGDNWKNNAGWRTTPSSDSFSSPGTECEWYGVLCNSDKTHVHGLDLSDNRLRGTIPSEIGDLTHMVALDLSSGFNIELPLQNPNNPPAITGPDSNQLTGTIPSRMGGLSRLELLALSGNRLSGKIPAEIGGLTGLRFLYLHANALSGPLPPSLMQLAQLEDNASLIWWNALYTENESLRDFINQKHFGNGFETTQTTPPTDLQAVSPTETSVTLTWKPIPFTETEGGYEVEIAQTPDGPFTLIGATPDKETAEMVINDLHETNDYYVRLRTRTEPHANNPNRLFSDYTETVALSLNRPPIADAGPDQTVPEEASVRLSAENSHDPEDEPLAYFWIQITGPYVDIGNPYSADTEFTAPATNGFGVSLTFLLTVTDSSGQTDSDEITVTVVSTNLPPTAEAGPNISVPENESVRLSAADSHDPDGEIVFYQWNQTAGPGVTLQNADTSEATFISPAVEPSGAVIEFELTVIDDGGLQSTDTVTVNVVRTNRPPVADAGSDQTAAEGQTVLLDGSRSFDPEGAIAGFRWQQTSGIQVVLSDPAAPRTELTVPQMISETETLVFRLTVEDAEGLRDSDEVAVVVLWENNPPTAEAGPDRVVETGAQVRLTGADSVDSDDGIADYTWRQTAGPPVDLITEPGGASAEFIAPRSAESPIVLTFQLTVTDRHGLSGSDEIAVTVRDNRPPQAPEPIAPTGAVVVSARDLFLTAGPFVDPDTGDMLAASIWEIRRADRPDAPRAIVQTPESGDGPLTQVLFSGAVSGMKYTWRVRYQDAAGAESPWSAAAAFFTGQTESFFRALPPADPSIPFTMVSFPVWPKDPDPEVVFGLSQTQYETGAYRIGVFEPALSGYIEFGQGLTVAPGRSYWVFARNGLEIRFPGTPVSTDIDIDLTLSVSPGETGGWHMIAPPNDRIRLWGDIGVVIPRAAPGAPEQIVTVADLPDDNALIDRHLWRYKNGTYQYHHPDGIDPNIHFYEYDPDPTLVPAAGYWVRTKTSRVRLRFLVSPVPYTGGIPPPRSRRKNAPVHTPPPPPDLHPEETADEGGGCFLGTLF